MTTSEREQRLAAIRSVARIDTEFPRTVVEFLLAEIDRLRDEVDRLNDIIRDVGEVHQPDHGHCGVCADHKGEAAKWPCETADLVLADVDGVDETTPKPDTITLEIARDDAHELSTILMSDRYRMDKGDNRPLPQPRWGANVRVAEAVDAALTALYAKES